MLTAILLKTVVLPLCLGLALHSVALAAPSRRAVLLALLLPLMMLVAELVLDGWPALPPVSAKHKLAYVVLAGGAGFGLVAALGRPLGRLVRLIALALAVAAPLGWLGVNILANTPDRRPAILLFALVAWASLAVLAESGRGDGADRRAGAVMAPAAVLWLAIAASVMSALGAFLGQAQLLGALAAIVGGGLLVGYGGWVLGRRAGIGLPPVAATAAGWVAIVFVAMAMLFAEKVSHPGLIVACLTLMAPAAFERFGPALDFVPAAIRPLAFGLLPAVPAALALVIAASGP